MNKEKIKTFNDIIASHNQFTHNSLLWPVIKDVWGVSDWKAKKLAHAYCNVISFYAVIYASGITKDSLKKFMEFLRYTPYLKKPKKMLLDKDGYINDKRQIMDHYDFQWNKIRYDNYSCLEKDALDDRYFYHMKIQTGIRKYHFMGCYVENGELYISCSSSRGIGVLARDIIPENQFHWIEQIS